MKITYIVLLFLASLALTGCGFNGGCDNLCGGGGVYAFNYSLPTCCTSTPW